MFYEKEFTPNVLRFGDVIEGYVKSLPILDTPIFEASKKEYKYHIESFFPKFSIVMTPCCNIENQLISLSPLKQIPTKLFDNPHFVEDFTRLNKEIPPEQAVSPYVWNNKFTEEIRQERLSSGKGYAFNYYFFYKENDIFPEYEIDLKGKKYKSRYYLVDFRYIYPLRCDKITKNKIDDLILQSKCLELDVITREELRDKLAYYYGRPTLEDKTILSS